MALVSLLCMTAAHWNTPIADYPTFQLGFPYVGDPNITHYQNHAALVGQAVRSPTVLAIMLTGDNLVCIAHTPTIYTPNPMNHSPFDNQLVIFIGNELESVTPIVVIEETTLQTTAVGNNNEV
jgi:hypothetical protein